MLTQNTGNQYMVAADKDVQSEGSDEPELNMIINISHRVLLLFICQAQLFDISIRQNSKCFYVQETINSNTTVFSIV